MPRIPVLVAAAACLLAVAVACSRASGQPRIAAPPPSSSTPPSVRPTPTNRLESPTPSPTTRQSSSARATGFPDGTAISCGGRPSADQVIAVLRRSGTALPSGAPVTVRTGPLCAGSWQYTVIAVPDHEPLQVITRGTPSALTFVTAGTDVCTSTVRSTAPIGILTVAHCI